MITVTNINDKEMIINSDFIECIEIIPDTKITLTTGRKIIVKEDADEIVSMIIEYKRKINALK